MEIRVILRGALSGFVAGVLGFIFARIFAEPVIDKAIDYESGRDAVLAALNHAAGRPVAPDGPEIFSRSIQSTIGIATGIIAFATAMGALIAVAYLVLHGRFSIRPRNLVWLIAGIGLLGVYPQPITNILSRPLVIRGRTIAPGQIAYPGFDADVLWKFRWYSIINQLLIWTVTALIFGALLERYLTPPQPRATTEPADRERAWS